MFLHVLQCREMSLLTTKETPCTYCQFPNESEVWTIINVQEDPELKDILLGGELNMTPCESCGHIFYAEHFLLYHDTAAQLMAFVYPYEERAQREFYEQKTAADFEQYKTANAAAVALNSYEPVTFFGVDELLRLLEWEAEASLQADVAAFLSQEKGFSLHRLTPACYRRHRLPPLWSREDMMRVADIVQANPQLTVYAEAQAYLSTHPEVVLEWA
jgi:hypothetical protein